MPLLARITIYTTGSASLHTHSSKTECNIVCIVGIPLSVPLPVRLIISSHIAGHDNVRDVNWRIIILTAHRTRELGVYVPARCSGYLAGRPICILFEHYPTHIQTETFRPWICNTGQSLEVLKLSKGSHQIFNRASNENTPIEKDGQKKCVPSNLYQETANFYLHKVAERLRQHPPEHCLPFGMISYLFWR